MKAISRVSFFASIMLFVSCSVTGQDILKYVDPNIDTAHSRWFFYTPAAVPFGMAKLAPSTNGHYGNASGWEATGYDVRDSSIEGFVHFHEWQVGGVSFMPTAGKLKVKPGELGKPGSGYRSNFERKNEIAEPGYYKVLLDDYHITAELTATKHVGFHRYTFSENAQSRIILDIGNQQGESGEVTEASVQMIDDTHFEGFVKTYPKYVKIYDETGQVAMYFYGEISKKPGNGLIEWIITGRFFYYCWPITFHKLVCSAKTRCSTPALSLWKASLTANSISRIIIENKGCPSNRFKTGLCAV